MTTLSTRSWVCSSWKTLDPTLAWPDVGAAWVKYLPTRPRPKVLRLKNLQAGVPPMQAAEVDNPFIHWIGADIRSDPWGYAAPGYPEKARRIRLA